MYFILSDVKIDYEQELIFSLPLNLKSTIHDIAISFLELIDIIQNPLIIMIFFSIIKATNSTGQTSTISGTKGNEIFDVSGYSVYPTSTISGTTSGKIFDVSGYSTYPTTTTTIANVEKRRRRSIIQSSQSITHMPIGGCLIISLNPNTTNLVENLYKEHIFLKYFPFGVQSLVGIDGQKIDLFNYLRENKISKYTYNQLISQDYIINGNYLTMGALGCLESHVRAWKYAVKLNMPMLILEEDVQLNKELLNIMFPYLIYSLPTNFSLFYFGNLVGKEMETKLIDYNEFLWKINGSNWGTYAYIISPSCAATLLNLIYPIQAQVDSMIINIANLELFDVFMSKILLVNTNYKYNRKSYVQRYLISPIIIPRIFHFIWLNNNSLSDNSQRYLELWKKYHPNWKIFLWTHETIINRKLSLYNQKHFQNSIRNFRQASDILRYEILYQYGGIYIDLDFEPLKNLEILLHGIQAFVAYESEYFICNGIFGAIPGHELTQRLIIQLESNWALYENGTINQQTGPYYITKQVKIMQQEEKTTMKDGFQIFAPHIFFPYAWYEKDPGHPYDPLAFAVHHFRSIAQIKQDTKEKY
ncbi:unnamed protein product [Rotaria sordida]|uniref:Glycosyl transferase family 25 domain-containing protein n=1 Tax=Rotaria sordida TaxID=392033 RepID=A0A819S461_9BILA|nr:unnamed protein product [Rotaria sordida]CAF4053435.1 unnamed protein product [Rotaria sordida]